MIGLSIGASRMEDEVGYHLGNIGVSDIAQGGPRHRGLRFEGLEESLKGVSYNFANSRSSTRSSRCRPDSQLDT